MSWHLGFIAPFILAASGCASPVDLVTGESMVGKTYCAPRGVTVGDTIWHGGVAHVVTAVNPYSLYRCTGTLDSVALAVKKDGRGNPIYASGLAGVIEQDPKLEGHGCAPFNARDGNTYLHETGRRVEIVQILGESPQCPGARPLAVKLR